MKLCFCCCSSAAHLASRKVLEEFLSSPWAFECWNRGNQELRKPLLKLSISIASVSYKQPQALLAFVQYLKALDTV